MSGPTKIEWADSSWNPVTGCTKVSAGCARCYAERQAKRFAGRVGYPKDNPFAVTLHPERLNEPLRWRKPRRIFVCSMGDLFHPDVPDEFIDQVFNVMAQAYTRSHPPAQVHTFMILTKRPKRMAQYLRSWLRGQDGNESPPGAVRPLWNVWLGTSVEDQPTADERIPYLLRCPAAVRFMSYEPALRPVGLHSLALSGAKPSGFIDALGNQSGEFSFQSHRVGDLPSLDWVIAGGESGPHARPAHPDWFRSVRDQCQAAGVPFFFKQWGEWAPALCRGDSFSFEGLEKYHVWDRENVSRRVGKKAAGRLLDGVEHKAYPGEGRS